jgi:hypothetical protein
MIDQFLAREGRAPIFKLIFQVNPVRSIQLAIPKKPIPSEKTLRIETRKMTASSST